MIPNIEEVDLIGPVTNLTSLAEERHLVGQVDYIVSSHNFEHIPDPVRFLQACEKILKRGGVLSMAIPDRRTCFDYFRPHSTTGELLDAFWQRRDRPTPGQLFSHHALHAYNYIDGADRTGWSLTCDPSSIRVVGNLEVAMSHARLQLGGRADLDIDVHCWAFTPASFELIISELQTLGLLDMRLKKVVGPNGHEFYAHFVNEALEVPSVSSLELARKRTELLHRVNDEAGTNSVSSNTRDRTLRELQAALSTRA
jgi:SAM-dependent methyltransferase